jgi:hypothetical protein
VAGIADAVEQARFRTLLADVERLRSRQTNGVNVLVFQGLSAYYAERDANRASDFFTRAAAKDSEHVKTHILAAGGRVDRAYDALLRSDDT